MGRDDVANLKKRGRRSVYETAVRYFRVFGKVVDVFDRCVQTSAGNGRGQVGGVRRGHDQSEKPPHSRH